MYYNVTQTRVTLNAESVNAEYFRIMKRLVLLLDHTHDLRYAFFKRNRVTGSQTLDLLN